MTTQVAQQTPVSSTPQPVDPDAVKWEELAKEVGVEPSEAEPEPTPEPAAETSEPAEHAEPATRPAPTELDNLKTALKEAREAQKAEAARTDAILAALREAKERRDQQQAPAKEAEAPQLPDVQADPIGHFTGRIAQLEEALRYAYQGGQQQTQQITAHLQEQAMWETVRTAETEIRSQKPDYDDACQHLEGARIRQLEQMYPSASPQVQAMARQQGFQDANQFKLHLLNQDRRAVATHALQMGTSPAQLYYDLAVSAGYQAKTNGNTPPPAASLVERAQQQIAATKKGTKASLTVSGDSGGRKGAVDMSIDDLAELFLTDPDLADKTMQQMGRDGRLG